MYGMFEDTDQGQDQRFGLHQWMGEIVCGCVPCLHETRLHLRQAGRLLQTAEQWRLHRALLLLHGLLQLQGVHDIDVTADVNVCFSCARLTMACEQQGENLLTYHVV